MEHLWRFKSNWLTSWNAHGLYENQCVLCQRDDSRHYNQKEWPARKKFVPGRFNVLHIPLVDPQTIYLPPPHIKLGLFKNFVKQWIQLAMAFCI